MLGEEPAEAMEHGSPSTCEKKEQPQGMEDGPGPLLTRDQQRSLRASQARGRGGKGAGRGRGRGKCKQDVVEDFDEEGGEGGAAAEDLPKHEKPTRRPRAKATPKAKAKAQAKAKPEAKAKGKAKVEVNAKAKSKSKQVKNPPRKNPSLLPLQQSEQGVNLQAMATGRTGLGQRVGSVKRLEVQSLWIKGLASKSFLADLFCLVLLSFSTLGWLIVWVGEVHFTTKQIITQHVTC